MKLGKYLILTAFVTGCSFYNPYIDIQIKPPEREHPLTVLQSSEIYYKLEWFSKDSYYSELLRQGQDLQISTDRYSPVFFCYYPVFKGTVLEHNPAGGMYIPIPGEETVQLKWGSGPSVLTLSGLFERGALPEDFNIIRYSKMDTHFEDSDPWNLDIYAQEKRILDNSFRSTPPASLPVQNISMSSLPDGIMIPENPFQAAALPVNGRVELNLTPGPHYFVQPDSRTLYMVEPVGSNGEYLLYRIIY